MKWIAQYYQSWLKKRSPAKKHHVLKQRNLYIFPSRLGGCYLLLSMLLWLLGTNYDNNLILGVSYLFISIFLLSIFHGYFNLQGLNITNITAESVNCEVFVGDIAFIDLGFSRSNKNYQPAIKVSFKGAPGVPLDFSDQQSVQISLGAQALQRGLLPPPRLSIISYYPLGIIRCWSELSIETQQLVFPSPVENPLPLISGGAAQGENKQNADSREDQEQEYQSLQLHRAGEPLSKIAWKQYARTQVLYTKTFAADIGENKQLSWHSYPDVEAELRLQYLCYQALELHAQQQAFSLELVNTTIVQGSGDEHLQRVLTALALYEPSLVSTK
ncbi:MAG: hypothetical protein ACI9ES_001065 [Oceanospirillaceae bacterium]|jgi:uncharacterized protein (DUF58 family)